MRNDLQAPHWPSLQPCISISPCRKAPFRTVSSSSTSNSMPTGSSRPVFVSPICSLPVPVAPGSSRPASGWLLPRLAFSDRRVLRGAAAARATGLVASDVLLPLLRRHLVQQHVGAVERVTADVVERPHRLRIEVEV